MADVGAFRTWGCPRILARSLYSCLESLSAVEPKVAAAQIPSARPWSLLFRTKAFSLGTLEVQEPLYSERRCWKFKLRLSKARLILIPSPP